MEKVIDVSLRKNIIVEEINRSLLSDNTIINYEKEYIDNLKKSINMEYVYYLLRNDELPISIMKKINKVLKKYKYIKSGSAVSIMMLNIKINNEILNLLSIDELKYLFNEMNKVYNEINSKNIFIDCIRLEKR